VESTQLILFVAASLAVIITPGQDLLLVMSRAVSLGSKAGVITASGVSFGLLGHSILAALGLGALILASKTLFTCIKFVGAGYLFYLGIRLIFSKSQHIELGIAPKISPVRLFLTGAFSNISNPHVTIFYLAFLPQFISANAQNPTLDVFVLGVSFALLTFIIKGPVGFFAGTLSLWLRSHPFTLKWIENTSGAILIGLGIKLILAKRL
jgi:threonine/homoserine/homoserine lactone efflux protein